MKKFAAGIVFVLCAVLQGQAHQLRGKVTEPSGDPVPYANVFVENTTYGVVTNVKGEYFLELESGDYTLVVSSMGYETQRVPVKIDGQNQTRDITLPPIGVTLETVNIAENKRDPAYGIMEKVIANKKEYIRQFEAYSRSTYLKASLEVDTLKKKGQLPDSLVATKADTTPAPDSTKAEPSPEVIVGPTGDAAPALGLAGNRPSVGDNRPKLNFIESQATTYFQRPNRYKSIVHAYRDFSEKKPSASAMIGSAGIDVEQYQTETNNPYLFYLDASDAEFNFYENLITVLRLGDRPFISPLSATSWRLSYRYRLDETFYEDGRVVYKIRVTPRNPIGPFFEGDLYIVDQIWAIKSVNFRIVEGNLSYFKDFRLLHNYTQTEDERWILDREDYYYMVKEGRQRYYGNTIALHRDYQLDPELPRNFFRNELRRVEKEAFERDSSFWDNTRPITLKQAEADFIQVADSIQNYYRSDEYLTEQDSIYNRLKLWDFILQGVGFRDRRRGMHYFFNPLVSQPRPFGVGGYRHVIGGNVKKIWSRFNQLRVSGELDFGVVNRDLKGYARVDYTYSPKHFARGYVRYGNRFAMVNNFETIAAILSRSNFIQKIYYGIGHHIEVSNGVFLDVGTEFADRVAIKDLRLADWSQDLFGDLNDPREFEPYREFLLDVKVRWVPGQKYNMEPYRKVLLGSTWPEFVFQYKKAIPGIWGSEINFDYLGVTVTDEFRPGTMGISRYAIRAGTFFQENNIRFNNFQFFRGSDPIVFANPLQAFQLLGPTISTTNEYLQVNYLHDFSGALINKIPLLKRTPLQVVAGAGILAVRDNNFFHSEAYAGLALPFRIAKQRLKVGVYYVGAYSTNVEQALNRQLKVGLTFFDTYKNRWNY
ncbi:MAG: DUF5686 and carboxypeptidase regulatory-like domain-containing protein [Bacteroidota bacterium]